MQRQMNLQGQKARQLDLFSRHRHQPANCNDPFESLGSASTRALLPMAAELARLKVDRIADHHQKFSARGLSLADAIARSGPLDGYPAEK
jgi:hypothetical protein